MAYVMMVKICNSWEYLSHDYGCLWLCQGFSLDYQVEKLTSFAYLSHKVDSFLGLIDFIELDDVGMVQFFE